MAQVERRPGASPGAVDLAVVLVSHNTRDLLRTCLASLAALSDQARFHVMVVDNASGDGSPDMVRAEFPRVELMANRVNVGYSRGVNQAVRVAEGRYVLLLNPDIVVRPGAVDTLARFMDQHPRAGVAGGRLLNPDGTLQYSCRSFYTFRTLLYRRTFLGKLFPRSRVIRDHLLADWDHAEVRAVDWMLGACLMVRREAIREVGLMDERFFLYFEDVDWCYRMKKRGWEVFYVPEAVMVHHHRRESAQGIADPRFLTHLNSVFHFYDKWNHALFTLRRYRHQARVLLLLASDLVVINLAFLGAYGVRYLVGRWLVKPLFPLATYGLFLAFVNVTTALAFFATGLYRRREGEGEADELLRVGRAVFASFLILMAATFLAQSNLVSRAMIYVFWPLAGVLAAGGRLLLRRLHRAVRALRFDLRRALIAGAGSEAASLEAELRSHPELGYEVVGVLSTWQPAALTRIIREEQVEEILVAGPDLGGEDLSRLILAFRGQGVPVKVFSPAAELVALGGDLVELGDAGALGFRGAPWRAPSWLVKRWLDVAGSALGLGWLGLVLLVRALRAAGKIQRGRAAGRSGRPFELAFFPGESGERFHQIPLRRALPQFWNVLRGEMSLVGPRPRAAAGERGSAEPDPLTAGFRPGMTGLWRLRGRSAGAERPAEEEARLDELDRRYAGSWSLSLDLRILLETCIGGGR